MSAETETEGLIERLHRARDRCRDHALSALLVVEASVLFVATPLFADHVHLSTGFPAIVLLAMMSLTVMVARGRHVVAAGVGTLALLAASVALRRIARTEWADLVGDFVNLATISVLSVVVSIAVFRPGRFTSHRIRGAVVLYLNLGLVFAILHGTLAEIVPGAYGHLPSPADHAAFRAALDYFSFSTLTSVGYGDILPLDPLARSLSILEATVGQLLPTVLIGRVVILAMQDRDHPDP